ncbi:hypothetical protein LIA77_09461 [Sarocladium implicatum]|nr:hypothetical protein LIA77_09461 [Sarocladium implicatum]
MIFIPAIEGDPRYRTVHKATISMAPPLTYVQRSYCNASQAILQKTSEAASKQDCSSSLLFSRLTILESLVSVLIRSYNLPLPTLPILIRPIPQREAVRTALIAPGIRLIHFTRLRPPALPILPAPIKTHLPLGTCRPIVPATNLPRHRADPPPIARGAARLEITRVDDAGLDALVAVVEEVPAAADGVDALRRGGGVAQVLAGSRAGCDAGAVGVEGDAVEGREAVAEGATAGGADLEGGSGRDAGCQREK